MRFRLLLLASVVALSAACGSQEIPSTPTLFIDRTNLGFGQELNSGTYIGTITYESILLRNDGVADLIIASPALTSPDNTFTIEGPDKTTLAYKDTASIQFAFKPTQAKVSSGTLVITSNAKNTPEVTVNLSACGVTPPTGSNSPDLSYCKNSTDF